MQSKVASAAVGASSAVLAIEHTTYEAFISLGLGLLGVGLARAVFINKERRLTGMQPRGRDTLPLTLVAMLVTGVIIWDRRLGLSFSVFTGLGVGWTAILLLDVVGAGVLNFALRALGQNVQKPPMSFPGDLPDDHVALLKQLDKKKDRPDE